MPSKNVIKRYLENGFYHLYNRGVEKRKIFLDEQDYSVFLSYLKEYLLPKDEDALYKIISDLNASPLEKDKARKLLRLNNFSKELVLLSYCLMPNHFHFFVKQKSPNSIDKFMNSLCTRYTMYFNKKYKRVGSLYQGVYKAVLIQNHEQFLHLSRYIHKQALVLQGVVLQNIRRREQPSSYKEYLGQRKTDWINTSEILSYFSKNNPSLSYQAFVNEIDEENEILQEITLDD